MKKPGYVLSLITQDNDYQIEQAASAEDAARRLGVNLEIVYADNDSIQQSQQILKFIQTDPDSLPAGIILEPVGGTALPQVARAAAAAGIGWAVLNRSLEYVSVLRSTYRTPMFCVAADNEEVGRIQGRQFAALLPKGGIVLYLQGPSETSTAKLRTSGMYETKPADVEVKVMRAQWTEASAFKAIQAWLRLSTSQQSQVDVIAAQNDAMAVGAKKAFQELANYDARANWLGLPYIGCDGVPKTGQAWVRSGLLAATVITPPLAGQALEMMAQACKTGSMPPELTLVPPRSFPALESLVGADKGKLSAKHGSGV